MNKNKNIGKKNLPLMLLILDGWGYAKPNRGNATTLAKTPNLDKLNKEYPRTFIEASGKYVGLPPTQDGNSEAGHINIGAGRLVEQDAVRIGHSINTGVFFRNPAFLQAIKNAEENNSSIHLMGMLSNGMSAHSDPDHLLALLEIVKKSKIKNIYLHLFTDGRDSPKYVAKDLIENLRRCCLAKNVKIATIMGRFYAMDRKKKWSRTEKTYEALLLGKGKKADSALEAIKESYNKGVNDEFIEPYILGKTEKERKESRIKDKDSIIFINLRSDRARQLAKVFVQTDFNKSNPGSFKRKKVLKNLYFVAMTDFGPDLDNIMTAFPAIDLKDTLPITLRHLKQLYLAETEKYAHVTYFFNGGYPGKVNGEDQKMIPSPDVKSYDEQPAMKSKELADFAIKNIDKYEVTVLNLAAPDMVGHTGNLTAGVECCEAVDKQVGRIVKSYLQKNGTVIITADHGNIEKMIDLKTDSPYVEHTSNPVPFLVVNKKLKNKIKLKKEGALKDISPTILDILDIEKPYEMTGESLIKKYE